MINFQYLNSLDLGVLNILLGTSISFFNIFACCYGGQIANDSYAEMANYLFESSWQTLPLNLRKYLIIMITNAQKPLFYHGLGLAIVDLQNFTNVSTFFKFNI